jgi:hypothetical protein
MHKMKKFLGRTHFLFSHQQNLKLEPFMIMMVKYINANYDQTMPFILQTQYYKFVVATGFIELIPQCCRVNGHSDNNG